MTVTHEHAVEVDTKLADLWWQAATLQQTLGWAIDELHRQAGEKRGRNPKTWHDLPWETTVDEVLAKLRPLADPELVAAPWPNDREQSRAKVIALNAHEAVTKYDAAVQAVRANDAAQRPLVAEYEADRWPRFFLVQNTGGHIHSSMRCQTTFPTTRWAWLPQLSGLGEDAAVAAEGPRLCSVCFPSAPVEWTLGLPAKVNPNRCPGSGQTATDVTRKYRTPWGRCSGCGTTVAVSNTDKARPHNTPKGA